MNMITVIQTATGMSYRCACGYHATNRDDIDDHVIEMARAGEPEGAHRELSSRY